VEVGGQSQEDLFDHTRAYPVLEAPMDGLVRAVSVGQGVSGRTGAQNPQHAVEDRAPVAPRSAAAVGSHRTGWQEGRNEFPLLARQFPTKDQRIHPPMLADRMGYLLSHPRL